MSANLAKAELFPRWDRTRIPIPPALAPSPALAAKIRGMLLGLAVGDALGNPTEGWRPGARWHTFGEVHSYLPIWRSGGLPIGLPSDDTQLASWTVESLLRRGELDLEDLARTFASSHIVGIGSTVRAFLLAYKEQGKPWDESGRPSAGNGALMRIAPVLLPHLKAPGVALWHDVVCATVLTHNDEAAVAASVGFVGVLMECLARATSSPPRGRWWLDTFLHYARPVETGQRYRSRRPGLDSSGTLCEFLEKEIPPALEAALPVVDACEHWYSGAYLLESVPSVLYILASCADNTEEAIVRAVNDTFDNDTIAAVVGAAVGALHGADSLPLRWRAQLSGRTRDYDDGHVQMLIDQAIDAFL